jgi:hypothetical protein
MKYIIKSVTKLAISLLVFGNILFVSSTYLLFRFGWINFFVGPAIWCVTFYTLLLLLSVAKTVFEHYQQVRQVARFVGRPVEEVARQMYS